MKGTASVPSFSFQGSNKTGWYLSNTNEMSATINGTQYVTINSSGVISNATWGGTTIGPTAGGTGLISYSTGDILYASATNTLSKLSAGTNGYFLGLAGGVPTWLPVGAPGSVASFSAGTTGFTPNTPTIGSITLAGTLNTTNGGTGLTSFTSGGAVYATSTSALATGTLPTTAGGTGLASFTSGGAVYASSTSALATGTLPTTAGGTGLASFTSGGAVYASSTSALATGTLPTTAGGTGITSFTSGGAVYASSASTLSTGTLPIASGGTNSTATPTAGAVAYGTGTSISYSAAGTAGQYLVSGGTGVPTWQSLGPTLSTISFGTTGLTPSTPTSGAISVAGTLVPANGGTGITTVPANGQILIGNGTNYTAATLTAGTGISITNGAGSVTIASTNTGLASRAFSYFVGQL